MGGDSDHRLLRLWLSIDCTFVEPQHIVVTKKILPRFKYDKSKVELYQLALTTNLGNLWVANSTGHLGVDGLIDLLQLCVGATTEFTFDNKLSGGCCKMEHCHKPWFDADCCITKRELRLWLKANHDSHATKHQENKLFKKWNFFLMGNCKSSTYVYACQGGCALVLEKIPTKGTCCRQDQCSYAFGKLPWASWPIFTTHTTPNWSLSLGDETFT